MFTIELTKSYGVSDFKEDLKRLYYDTGVRDLQTSFLFNDTQIANEVFLEIINNILSTGEVSKLYKDEDFEEVIIINFDFSIVNNYKYIACTRCTFYRSKKRYRSSLKKLVFQKRPMACIRFSWIGSGVISTLLFVSVQSETNFG